jgi:hypothetical protein
MENENIESDPSTKSAASALSATLEKTSIGADGFRDLWDILASAKPVTPAEFHAYVMSSKDCTALLRRLLQYALWPDSPCLSSPNGNDLFSRRPVQKYEGRGAGEFFSKKLQRTVQYKSVLERVFFAMLEYSQDVVWYLEQPIKVRYVTDKEPFIYVPDVLVCLGPERYFIVEIKPVADMLGHSRVDKYLALRGYCSGLGWGLLMTDGRFSFLELVEHRLRSDYVAEICARLKEGPLFYGDYKEIKKVHGASKLDFAALVVQEEIEYTMKPFQLARNANQRPAWLPARRTRI